MVREYKLQFENTVPRFICYKHSQCLTSLGWAEYKVTTVELLDGNQYHYNDAYHFLKILTNQNCVSITGIGSFG